LRLGVAFSRAYSVLPICSPARASMLTELCPHAQGLTENEGRFGDREGFDDSGWMIRHALQRQLAQAMSGVGDGNLLPFDELSVES